MSELARLMAGYEKKKEKLNQELVMLTTGYFKTGRDKVIDTTEESINRVKEQIAELDKLIATYADAQD